MASKPWIHIVASSSDVSLSGNGKNECQRTDLTILYVCPATRSLNGRRKGFAKACPLRGAKYAVLWPWIYGISAGGSRTKAAHSLLTTVAKA